MSALETSDRRLILRLSVHVACQVVMAVNTGAVRQADEGSIATLVIVMTAATARRVAFFLTGVVSWPGVTILTT